MDAGKLRHRVQFQALVDTRNTFGEAVKSWIPYGSPVWAQITPLSVREFTQAQQLQSKISARIVVRHRTDLAPSMRVVHGTDVYNIEGVLADPDSGMEYITLPVSRIDT